MLVLGCSYLPSIESVLNYLASLHITTSGGRHPDAILLDAPAPAPSATPGRSLAAASGRSLAAVGRMRAALEEAALTVSAVSAGGRCAALMVSEPAGGRPGRPPDRHTVQLVNAAPGTVQLNCGTLSCLLSATQHCLLPRHVSVSA